MQKGRSGVNALTGTKYSTKDKNVVRFKQSGSAEGFFADLSKATVFKGATTGAGLKKAAAKKAKAPAKKG